MVVVICEYETFSQIKFGVLYSILEIVILHLLHSIECGHSLSLYIYNAITQFGTFI